MNTAAHEPLNCTQCGNILPINFRYTRLVVCSSCSSTLYLEDDALRYAGRRSVLSDMPCLIELNKTFIYQKQHYHALGYARYRYQRGCWDEWWVINEDTAEGVWLSVDEGDYAFEHVLTDRMEIPAYTTLALGKSIQMVGSDWRVTETGEAACEGYVGQLPELVEMALPFQYVHLSEPRGGLMTIEYFPDRFKVYQGQWIDHYSITINSA